ncbi:MAG: potassium channel family protein, partial [FCB group bacterium]
NNLVDLDTMLIQRIAKDMIEFFELTWTFSDLADKFMWINGLVSDEIIDKLILPIISLFTIAFDNGTSINIQRILLLQIEFFELLQKKYKILSKNFASTQLLTNCEIFRKKYKNNIRINLNKYHQFNKIMIFLIKNHSVSDIDSGNLYYQYYEGVYTEMIICDKEMQRYDLYSIDVYNFEKIRYYYKREEKERNILGKSYLFIKYLPRLITGYGEKPQFLIIFYFFLLILFSSAYLLPFFEFNYSNGATNISKFISFLYFSCTTMLTIGYGDITPKNELTMLIVMLQQIIGFLTAGSFIALYLRKLFRY